MEPKLEKRCMEYLAYRDAVRKAFRLDNKDLYDVCASIFCACGQTADTEKLKECRKIIKKKTRPFSGFRSSKVRAILASMLSIGDDPEKRMDQANESFRLLKRQFRNSEYLVLTAFLFSDLADKTLTEEDVIRGKEIYVRMNEKHRILTDKTDSVFAMLLAYSGKGVDELIEEIETCYTALKDRFPNSGSRQTAAQVLAMAAGTPEEKAQHVIDLYDALLEADVQYGRSDTLPPLAALSLSDTPVPVLVEDIRAADVFLKAKRNYGFEKEEKEKRAMHAVMIVSDQFEGPNRVNVTAMTNVLDMLIAKQTISRISFGLNVLQTVLQVAAKSDEKEEKAESSQSSE